MDPLIRRSNRRHRTVIRKALQECGLRDVQVGMRIGNHRELCIVNPFLDDYEETVAYIIRVNTGWELESVDRKTFKFTGSLKEVLLQFRAFLLITQ